MQRPSALLWDWDNTLIDGWAAIAHALNAVFDARDMPRWSVAETQARVRGSLRDTFPTMFGAGWEAARDLFYATLAEQHLTALRPLPGAEAALTAGAAWPQGVVSNKAGRFLRREVSHLGWSRFFASVIGAGDATSDKPTAAPLLLALAPIGPADRSVWYLGDTDIDMRAARAAGCTAVLIGDAASDGGPAHIGPDLHFADAAAVAACLRSLASETR